MSDRYAVEVIARFRLDELKAQEKAAMGMVEKMNRAIDETQRKMQFTWRKMGYALVSTVSTLRAVLSAFGVSIPPVFDAVFSAINTTIYALQAIAASYAAGGVTAVVTLIVEAAAIGLSIVGIAAAIRGQQDAQNALNQAESAARNIGLTLNAWQRTLGGF